MVMWGKQPVAWREHCPEHCIKEFQESMHRCTGHRDITEITLERVFASYNQSIDQLFSKALFFRVKVVKCRDRVVKSVPTTQAKRFGVHIFLDDTQQPKYVQYIEKKSMRHLTKEQGNKFLDCPLETTLYHKLLSDNLPLQVSY